MTKATMAIMLNRVKYQYSERLARPVNVAYLLNTLLTDWVSVIVVWFFRMNTIVVYLMLRKVALTICTKAKLSKNI